MVMRRLAIGSVLFALVLSTVPLFALHTGGSHVIIPVIGRFPGAGGTQWRTDIFVSNPYTPTHLVTLKFYPNGAPVKTATFTIGPFSSATLTDVVLNTFALTNSAGMLEVSVPEPFTIEARATIYNAGNAAGQFGQGVPGIDMGYLNRQAFIFGLSGVSGSRVNIGVANPNAFPISVTTDLSNASGTSLFSRTDTLAAHAYMQFNDVFTTFGITPQANVVLNFNSPDGLIYGYTSEVRNDTGDAIFTFGISPNS
jgi:hypothetical protein